jgi:hypothetical protein
MAILAALMAASLAADPARLVLGRDAGAELTLRAPASAAVTLTASVGTVKEVRREGDVWRARFIAPARKVPAVALLLAQVDEDGSRSLAWLAIPLSGSDTMEIETRPGSRVQADVAGTTIGPVIADASGIVRLPMVVPPGVDKAMLHITDKLGNSSEKPLDLEPPPFSRVRMASRSAGASGASPTEVEIFVVKPDGTPDDDARVEVSADIGEVELRKRTGPGVYLARYLAPARNSGTAHLEAKANGQLASVDVPVSGRRGTSAEPIWWSALASEQPWSISVGLLGGVGSTFDGATEGTALLEMAARINTLPVEAVVDLGASFFSTVTQYGNYNSDARAQSRLGEVGVRLGRQLATGLDGHAALLVGFQSQVVLRTLPNQTRFAQDEWTPRIAVALGANLRLGPGRALAQVQLDSSASGIAGYGGSLSGVQAMLGYLVTIR